MSKPNNPFNQLTPQEWKLKVQAELAGLDYNQVLVWDTAEGIQVKPVYTIEDLPENVAVEFTQKDWKIIGNYRTNENQDDTYLYGWNVSIDQLKESKSFPQYLDLFIHSEDVNQFTQFDFSSLPNLKYAAFDIIGQLARKGDWVESDEEKAWDLATTVYQNNAFEKSLMVDVALYQNAGANQVQQLAYAIAHAHEYVHKLGAEAAHKLYFKVAVGGNYFFEIAKLKALRSLWKLVMNQYEVEVEPYLYAETSLRNKSILDIHNNIIRSTLEASSAVLGKADVVNVLPYDSLIGGSAFSEELASKQQLLLQKESYYDKFHDPVAGSYFIENLQDLLAKNALDLFKKIEAEGGFIQALKEGNVQKSIQKSADKEQAAFDDGKLVLIGVNKFRNQAENIQPLQAIKEDHQGKLIQKIIPIRLATSVEQTTI